MLQLRLPGFHVTLWTYFVLCNFVHMLVLENKVKMNTNIELHTLQIVRVKLQTPN